MLWSLWSGMAFKGKKEKEKRGFAVSPTIDLYLSPPTLTACTIPLHHICMSAFLEINFIFTNYFQCQTIWPWHNNFNNQMTSDHQRRIHKRARNTLRHFSIIFSPSILHKIPVDLNDNLDLLELFKTALYSPKFRHMKTVNCHLY